MLTRISSRLSLAVAATMLISGTAAQAQLFPGLDPCNTCSAQVAYAPPVQQVVCAQPVQQVVYRQVPVTEYKQVTEVVRKPIYETKYVNQQVTEWKQVLEQKTVEVPTVSYQNVTEYRTVSRDMGRWQTSYNPVAKCAPCQVDARPGLLGMMNRNMVRVRNAMTPNYTTNRQYVPNMVTTQVPVTRQVAIRGTQTMTYNVARMVPETVNKQVAVNTVRWEEETVTASRPVTVMRTVPIGTQTAFGFVPYSNSQTQTALQPVEDPNFRKAEGNDDSKKTADKPDNNRGASLDHQDHSAQPTNNELEAHPAPRATVQIPTRSQAPSRKPDVHAVSKPAPVLVTGYKTITSNGPAGGWKARKPSPDQSQSTASTSSVELANVQP